MRARAHLVTLITGALAWALAAGAQAPPQQPPKPAQEPAKVQKKAKKVWTEDDVSGLRKPWDKHADEKAAEEAKAAEAKAAEAKAAAAKAAEAQAGEEERLPNPVDPKTGKPYLDPDSPEALEATLKKWEEELKLTEELAEEARREMSQASDPERWESAKLKLETYQQNIEDIQKRLVEQRAKLEEAKKQKKGGAAPATTPPKPPQP